MSASFEATAAADPKVFGLVRWFARRYGVGMLRGEGTEEMSELAEAVNAFFRLVESYCAVQDVHVKVEYYPNGTVVMEISNASFKSFFFRRGSIRWFGFCHERPGNGGIWAGDEAEDRRLGELIARLR